MMLSSYAEISKFSCIIIKIRDFFLVVVQCLSAENLVLVVSTHMAVCNHPKLQFQGSQSVLLD